MASSAAPQRWTVLDLLNWTKDYFVRCELDAPRLAAELLLAAALDCKRMELYTRFDQVPDEQRRGRFREMVRQAAEGEPVAYLVGVREFYSLPLKVDPAVLIPRPETEILVDLAIDLFRRLKRPGRMWDLCTGSGAVALAVAAHTPDEIAVLATDISPEALAVAAANAERHKLSERVTLAAADLFTPIAGQDLPAGAFSGEFDLITANPPYINAEDMRKLAPQVQREPALALDGGRDGLDLVRRIVAGAPARLAPGGWLAVEIGYDQADAVWDLVQAAGFAEVRFVKDPAGIDRVLHCRFGEASEAPGEAPGEAPQEAPSEAGGASYEISGDAGGASADVPDRLGGGA